MTSLQQRLSKIQGEVKCAKNLHNVLQISNIAMSKAFTRLLNHYCLNMSVA